MVRQNGSSILVWITLSFFSLSSVISCTGGGGSTSAASNAMNTPTIVADKAMNNQGVVMALPSGGGFYGNLYVQPRDLMTVPDTQEVGCSQYGEGLLGLDNYFSNPQWITQQVLFQSLDVPDQYFTQGFPSGTGTGVLSVDSYFAMDVTGVFHLAPGDTAGYYQFAVIADDGAQLLVNSGDSSSGQMLVDDEKPASYNNGTCLAQTQASRMSCTSVWGDQTAGSVQTVYLTPGQVIPLEVKYWQGPGQALSLIVMYDKCRRPRKIWWTHIAVRSSGPASPPEVPPSRIY